MFKRHDKVIISKYGDTWFGSAGIVTRVSGYDVDVSITSGGPSRTFRPAELSAIPTNVDSHADTLPKKWKILVEFIDKADNQVIECNQQPAVSWGNGMVKVEIGSEIHLFSLAIIGHINVYPS